jgi:hypothetical protein
MKAFEQGATRTDVLGAIIRLGGAEAAFDAGRRGRLEAVVEKPLLVGESDQETPASPRPEFLVATPRALRVLKAAAAAAWSPRLTPEPPPRYGPTTSPEPLPDEPGDLLPDRCHPDHILVCCARANWERSPSRVGFTSCVLPEPPMGC